MLDAPYQAHTNRRRYRAGVLAHAGDSSTLVEIALASEQHRPDGIQPGSLPPGWQPVHRLPGEVVISVPDLHHNRQVALQVGWFPGETLSNQDHLTHPAWQDQASVRTCLTLFATLLPALVTR